MFIFFGSTEQEPREISVTEPYRGSQPCGMSQEDCILHSAA